MQKITVKLAIVVALSLMLGGCAALMAPSEVDPDDDGSIERAVRAEVRSAPVRGAGSVSVSVKDGVVTLGGSVPEPSAIGEIILRAEGVPGVRQVITEVEFDGSDQRREDTAPTASPEPTGQPTERSGG